MESDPSHPYIRLIDLRKDLAEIADLIDLCFRENLDKEGREYIRHLRRVAISLSSYLVDRGSPETSGFPFHGYVWVVDEKIIGNLTLIPIRKRDPHTYFIANVAVKPDYRGKGIARELTERAIIHVREHGGKDIFLQVRDDNDTAIHIYESQGFTEYSRRTTWVFSDRVGVNCKPDPGIKITRRKQEDWNQQRAWLMTNYPPSISWNFPFRIQRLEPGLLNWLSVFINGGNTRTWAARRGDHLLGTATWEEGFSDAGYIWLASSPALEDEAIRAMVPKVYSSITNYHKVMINFPAGRAEAAFREAGMQALHTLIWMKRSLSESIPFQDSNYSGKIA